ncbi:MAG: hypothetical protein HZA90_15110 [Verrucomicrobia bacterium]|nr:hypothetical protein [Verrucomicrobiota bacterium]
MKRRHPLESRTRAFTRVEALACLSVVAILAALAAPTLAGLRPRSDSAACVNNLRQIGRAYQIWGHDHNDDPPYRVAMSEGGIQAHPLAGNTWFQFSWVSNELATPRVLACPSDLQKRVAKDFGISADGGFLNSGFRNNAVSYWVGSDAVRFVPASLVCGDRNVKVAGYGYCSAGISDAGTILMRPMAGSVWTNNLHGLWGNVLRYDGQVRTLSNWNLTTNALSFGDDNGTMHLVLP